MPDTIDALIERLEKATAEDQERLLDEANSEAYQRGWITRETFIKAQGWIAAGAYESAALALVPAGGYWSGDSRGCCIVADNEPPDTGKYGIVTGHPSPTIALCIAALRAHQATGRR